MWVDRYRLVLVDLGCGGGKIKFGLGVLWVDEKIWLSEGVLDGWIGIW